MFPSSKNKPLEYLHTTKQHPDSLRLIEEKFTILQYYEAGFRKSSSEKCFRKYFGKKVIKLLSLNNESSFHSEYRLKALKKAKICCKFPINHSVRHLETLHVIDIDPLSGWDYSNGKYALYNFLTSVSDFKYLKSLKIEVQCEDISIRPLRLLRNLQALTFISPKEQFISNYNFLIDLRSLKRLQISFMKGFYFSTNEIEYSVFIDFLHVIARMKRLDFLGLNLETVISTPDLDSQSKFFDCLGKLEIPAFDIRLLDETFKTIDIDRLQLCLNNIDILTLNPFGTISIAVMCGPDNTACQSIEKARRKLELFNVSKLPTVNNKAITSQASDLMRNLEALYENCVNIEFPLAGISNIHHLKSFTMDLSRVSDNAILEADELFFNIVGNSKYLEHLDLHQSDRTSIGQYDVYQHFWIAASTADMTNLTRLRLEGPVIEGHLLSILCNLLSLKNLKELRLDLSIDEQDDGETETAIVIPEDSKLALLHLILGDIEEEVIPDFIKIILSLCQLENLTILEGHKLTEKETNNLVLLEGFKQLKKLSDVSISCNTKLKPVWYDRSGNFEEPTIRRMRSAMKELFDCNLSLQLICFDMPEDKVQYYRY